MIEKRISSIKSQIVFMTLVFTIVSAGWAQDHDLVMDPAPNITSIINPAGWKSPDLKIGADFGDTSVPNIVRRGVPNSIYARFRINGMDDDTINSGDAKIKFYYRSASIGDVPPALTDPSWSYIDELLVTFITSDGPFAVTRVWPTDFPSVTTKSISWNAPVSGDYFHVAAEVVYSSWTGITDDNPGDNVAISLYESQSGLLDIVLLHDTSGSMGYFMYGPYTYMELAKSKAATFIHSMNEAHRLAVVAFSSNYSGGSELIWHIPTLTEPAEILPATSANKSDAVTAIMGLSDSGATPMGAGLERAIQVLTTAMDPDRKRVILLLSDGYENYGFPRACSGSDPANPCVGGTILSDLTTNDIRVFTIALGTAAWTECLECLANQSDGESFLTDPGLDLAEVYLAMQQIYTGDDLYRVDRGVSGGGDDAYSTYFDGVDNVLYFVLSWDVLDANLDMQLCPPGRAWSNPEGLSNASAQRGRGYVVARVEKPAGGTWGYRIIGEEGNDYLAAVRSDRVGARLGMDVESGGVAGGIIKIQAHFAYGKKPVTNAKLMATIQVPVEASLETILRQASRNHMLKYKTTPIDPSVLKKKLDISPRAAFIKKITGDEQKPLVTTRSINVPLKHTGNGFYSGVLDRSHTTTAGQYRVTVKCSERRFHRNFSRQLRLHPGKIDYGKSFAEILMVKSKSEEEKPIWMLCVYPVDRFGNAITAPSLIKRVQAKVKGGSMFGKPEIVFGTFQQQLRVFPGQKPVLAMVTIDGQRLGTKRIDVRKPPRSIEQGFQRKIR